MMARELLNFMWIDLFFRWLLVSSLMGSALTLVILLVQFLLGRRMSAGWHYGLWLFLLIKLLIPFGPASSFSVFTVLNYLSGKIPFAASAPADTVAKVHSYLNPSYHWNLADPAKEYSISVTENPHFMILFLSV